MRHNRLPKTIFGNPAPIAVNLRSNPKKRGYLYARPSFVIPKATAVCVRRSMRREVLFARNKAGKGKRNYNSRARRNADSRYSC